MSRGKYSPWCYGNKSPSEHIYNAYGEVPVERNKDSYDHTTMYDGYDSEGFDCYGYSGFDIDGNAVDIGQGIDRYGYTENEYLSMTDEQFQQVSAYAEELTEFKRNRDAVKPKTKRKTKAQKQAEAERQRQIEQAADWQKFKAEYPTRFAALLFDFFKFGATDYNLNVVRTDNNYEFCWGTGWNRKSVDLKPTVPIEQNWQYLYDLESAESAIQEERDRIAEAERKQQLRQSALSKLSDEEKQALGFA